MIEFTLNRLIFNIFIHFSLSNVEYLSNFIHSKVLFPFFRVTTIKALNYPDDILSILFDSFKDHYVLVFDLTSMQDAARNCHYPELVGEPLRLALNFTFPLEHDTELIVLGEQTSSVAVDKIGVVGKNFWNG